MVTTDGCISYAQVWLVLSRRRAQSLPLLPLVSAKNWRVVQRIKGKVALTPFGPPIMDPITSVNFSLW